MAIAQLRTIDMCHYDSDKSYEGRMWAYPRLWEALRDGGVFISDDVNDNQAFRDFCESVGVQPYIMAKANSSHYVGIIIKPRS